MIFISGIGIGLVVSIIRDIINSIENLQDTIR